jgi:hypothetical protein
MPAPPHPAALSESELLADCEVRRTRRTGPGGQRRNKVETAVVIVHEPTGVVGEASERRSAEQNRKAALFRLRVNLALTVRRPRASDEPASALWQSRCSSGRLTISGVHEDFPAVLAEALDALASCEMKLSQAASALGCSTSQLARLLRLEPRGLDLLNQSRRAAGLRPLR